MNLSALPLPSGKTLTKPQSNLLGFLSSVGVTAPAANEMRSNPYSGKSHNLSPLACALFDFVMNTRKPFAGPLSYGGNKVTVAQWDRARYLFLALWPKEYGDLLD